MSVILGITTVEMVSRLKEWRQDRSGFGGFIPRGMAKMSDLERMANTMDNYMSPTDKWPSKKCPAWIIFFIWDHGCGSSNGVFPII